MINFIKAMVGLIGLAASIIGIFVFLTGRQSVREVLIQPSSMPTVPVVRAVETATQFREVVRPTQAENVGNDTGLLLGELVTSTEVDPYGCPINTMNQFNTLSRVFIVLRESDVPRGTNLFVRVYYSGNPVEDITLPPADRDYNDTCIWFFLEASSAATPLQAGNYTAQLIVNGQPIKFVEFQVS